MKKLLIFSLFMTFLPFYCFVKDYAARTSDIPLKRDFLVKEKERLHFEVVNLKLVKR